MSGRYEISFLEDRSGYKFQTSSGDIYIAYFTEFILLDFSEDELSVTSFGFTCKRANEELPQKHDGKIKHTIVHIIKEFFAIQNENAVLFMCINNDGKARNRHIVFGQWYNDLGKSFEKYDSPKNAKKKAFYGSILLKKDNPYKQRFIDSFYFTLDYWGLNS